MAVQTTLLKPKTRRGASIVGSREVEGGGFDFPVLITFDVTIDESHEASSDVTEHPIEDGGNISDHIQNKPRVVRMTIDHTATPLYQEGTPNRVFEAHETLIALRESRQPIRLVTSLEDYGNMALMCYSVTRDVRTDQTLRASLEWKEVNIASSQIVPIPANILQEPFKPSGKNDDEVPKQTETAATDKEKERGSSILNSVIF